MGLLQKFLSIVALFYLVTAQQYPNGGYYSGQYQQPGPQAPAATSYSSAASGSEY
uniref:Uncharacterized protein n=1 Tax=Plectus sambesii TaxID=2011161 RepID=A0A914XMG8_9BILA